MINVNYNAIAVPSKPGGNIMSGYVEEMILKLRLYVLHHKTRIISVCLGIGRIGTSNRSSLGYVLESGSV